MLNIEVLSPAGNTESLLAALNSGADAVYLGAKLFSARKNALNFELHELKQAVGLCRLYNSKAYLTLNTLLFDDELGDMGDLIDFAAEIGVDAIISQDLAVLRYINERRLAIPVHASTQMSVNSLAGAVAARKLGFSRVVLARELSLSEIREITRHCGVETEVFVHGALCVSVSGQCYMSAFLGGRSGNRGLCAQPCRLEFRSEHSEAALSLKDLSLVDSLELLDEAGVASAKIEGRMKRPEYVAAVTSACYKVKNGIKLTQAELVTIKSVFSRSGFTRGYFDGSFSDMSGVRTKADVTAGISVLKDFRAAYTNPLKKRVLDISIIMRAGKPIVCEAKTGNYSSRIELDPPENSVNRPLEKSQVIKQLTKLGGTVFETGEINCDIDDGLYVSVSVINGIRRTLLENIMQNIMNNAVH